MWQVRVNILLLLIAIAPVYGQTSLLDREISVSLQEEDLSTALATIEREGRFHFSYSPSAVPVNRRVSVSAGKEKVENILDAIFQGQVTYTQNGNHLILLPAKVEEIQEKQNAYLSGQIYDSSTGEPLNNTSVYDAQTNKTALTDPAGKFKLELKGEQPEVAVGVRKLKYRDTVLILNNSSSEELKIYIQPLREEKEVGNLPLELKPLPVGEQVNRIGVVKLLVREDQRNLSENIRHILEELPFQISLLPGIGTSNRMSGGMENRFSLNVLAGYSYSVEGVEIGGLVNITRNTMSGFQVAGLSNIVGGEVEGFQASGLVNLNLVNTKALQLSGILNHKRGKMKGVQVSGIANINEQHLNGSQVGGIANFAGRSFQGAQIAGIANFARSVEKGLQIGGVGNLALQMDGVQIAGLVNFAGNNSGGIQISGIANFALDFDGTQIGIFNFADTVSGASIGLLSLVKRVYHALELGYTDYDHVKVALKTGTDLFYNQFIFSIANPVEFAISDPVENGWGFGYGIGSRLPLGEKRRLSVDFSIAQINEQKRWVGDLNLFQRLELSYQIRIFKRLAIFGSGSINYLISGVKDEDGNFNSTLAQSPFTSSVKGDKRHQLWWGWSVGIRI